LEIGGLHAEFEDSITTPSKGNSSATSHFALSRCGLIYSNYDPLWNRFVPTAWGGWPRNKHTGGEFLVLNGALVCFRWARFWALHRGRPVWENAGCRLSYVSRRHASLGHASFAGAYLLWECLSRYASLTSMCLTGVHLISVRFMGYQTSITVKRAKRRCGMR